MRVIGIQAVHRHCPEALIGMQQAIPAQGDRHMPHILVALIALHGMACKEEEIAFADVVLINR
ncbi:MAG: hypothetical protein KatS3mg057_2422 [Herpetosiphonaceae bacterium]|nr:MAG: hypothetical protein KatS3mg057_2422 [Herpetosiphonaceae bacterium]